MSRPNGDSQAQTRPAPANSDALTLALDVDSLYAMRAAVAAHASRHGLTEPKLGNLLVVATELATNTIRHGGGGGTLCLWRDGNVIRCQVSDDGPGIGDPQRAGIGPVALNSNGGRGLWLIRQLSDDFAIYNRNPGATATATIAI